MQQNLTHSLMGSAGALVLSAAARALPAPGAAGSPLYVWFFQFAHLLLANFDKLGASDDIQSSRR